MNIASFARRGVLKNPEIARLVAERIADPGEIARARAFPYQAFQTAMTLMDGPAAKQVPAEVKRAVARALEATLENTPLFSDRRAYVLVDVSGSIRSPVTGWRRGSTTAPLAMLNKRGARGDLVLYISGNQSWVDSRPSGNGCATRTMSEWAAFKRRNPAAKMVCLDLQPCADTQAPDGGDVMNIGGFPTPCSSG